MTLVAGVVVAVVAASGLLGAFELPARDAMLRWGAGRPATATAVVAIDEEALRTEGPWPWTRERIAALVDDVSAAGPRAVGIDILLADARSGDELLGGSLARTKATLVCGLEAREGWVLPAPALRDGTRLAHGMIELDGDGVMRRVSMTKQAAGVGLPALSVALASAVSSEVRVAAGKVVQPGFRTRAAAIPTVSAARLSDPDVAAALRGRVVFVGLTALALGDRVVTPTTAPGSSDPGVLVHAAVSEAILGGDVLTQVAPALSGLLAALVVAAGLLMRPRGIGRRLARDVVILALPFVAGLVLLRAAGVALPVVALSLAAAIAVAASGARAMWKVQRGGSEAATRIARGLGGDAGTGETGLVERLDELAALVDQRRRSEVESRRVLAHELKTPLASVRGLTQLLSGYRLSEDETHRVVSLIQKEADKLQTMVGSLLEIEKLALRDFDATSTAIDLSHLARERAEMLRAGVAATLADEIEPGISVRGDGALLERAIDNLVGNAVKFSPPGSMVKLRLMSRESSAILEVEDRGPGVPEAERERIFDRFARGGAARDTEGLGLGLALVAEVAGWHRGRVDVSPGRVKGSVFRMTIPLTQQS
ncbi:MAG: CHASE2 domain-containing protein [Thermoanaerobaculia bacterium]|nr:CHASE2 domain-containing protein [Thermoanaerobaculia bacterium]